jgi:hypothetical protein
MHGSEAEGVFFICCFLVVVLEGRVRTYMHVLIELIIIFKTLDWCVSSGRPNPGDVSATLAVLRL